MKEHVLNTEFETCEGGCTCGHVRYRVTSPPMIVHGCHCRLCQKQTGSAFAINALIEADRIRIIQGEVEEVKVDTPSGNGQTIARCPKCRIALWSSYFMRGLKERIRFLRVGTLDNPDLMPPDVHIFTSTKQPWVKLPKEARRVDIFYEYEKTWSQESLMRRAALFEKAGLETP